MGQVVRPINIPTFRRGEKLTADKLNQLGRAIRDLHGEVRANRVTSVVGGTFSIEKYGTRMTVLGSGGGRRAASGVVSGASSSDVYRPPFQVWLEQESGAELFSVPCGACVSEDVNVKAWVVYCKGGRWHGNGCGWSRGVRSVMDSTDATTGSAVGQDTFIIPTTVYGTIDGDVMMKKDLEIHTAFAVVLWAESEAGGRMTSSPWPYIIPYISDEDISELIEAIAFGAIPCCKLVGIWSGRDKYGNLKGKPGQMLEGDVWYYNDQPTAGQWFGIARNANYKNSFTIKGGLVVVRPHSWNGTEYIGCIATISAQKKNATGYATVTASAITITEPQIVLCVYTHHSEYFLCSINVHTEVRDNMAVAGTIDWCYLKYCLVAESTEISYMPPDTVELDSVMATVSGSFMAAVDTYTWSPQTEVWSLNYYDGTDMGAYTGSKNWLTGLNCSAETATVEMNISSGQSVLLTFNEGIHVLTGDTVDVESAHVLTGLNLNSELVKASSYGTLVLDSLTVFTCLCSVKDYVPEYVSDVSIRVVSGTGVQTGVISCENGDYWTVTSIGGATDTYPVCLDCDMVCVAVPCVESQFSFKTLTPTTCDGSDATGLGSYEQPAEEEDSGVVETADEEDGGGSEESESAQTSDSPTFAEFLCYDSSKTPSVACIGLAPQLFVADDAEVSFSDDELDAGVVLWYRVEVADGAASGRYVVFPEDTAIGQVLAGMSGECSDSEACADSGTGLADDDTDTCSGCSGGEEEEEEAVSSGFGEKGQIFAFENRLMLGSYETTEEASESETVFPTRTYAIGLHSQTDTSKAAEFASIFPIARFYRDESTGFPMAQPLSSGAIDYVPSLMFNIQNTCENSAPWPLAFFNSEFENACYTTQEAVFISDTEALFEASCFPSSSDCDTSDTDTGEDSDSESSEANVSVAAVSDSEEAEESEDAAVATASVVSGVDDSSMEAFTASPYGLESEDFADVFSAECVTDEETEEISED